MLWIQRFVLAVVLLLFIRMAIAAETSEPLKTELTRYVQQHYTAVSQSPLQTGILYDLVLPLSSLQTFNGNGSAKAVTREQWLQAVYELRRASLESLNLPEPGFFRNLARTSSPEHIHPIVFLNFNYNQIDSSLSAEDVFEFRNGEITSIRPGAFVQRKVFAGVAINPVTYRGAETRYRMDLKNAYYSNDLSAPQRLDIDFDDGRGFRPAPSQGEMVIRYATTGKKILKYRLILNDGSELLGKSQFDVLALQTPNPSDTWTMQAAIPYLGQYAGGLAYLYLAPGHASLSNPIVISEGFDLDNSMNWDELYALLNQQNMVEDMRTLGYDAVVLNYTNATTYMEANAYLVEALIERVNQTTGNGRSIAVIGPSMGGLTTRFALADMEQRGLDHHVRTWISFDSPQRGANIPLGMQYWIDFFASQSTEAAALRDALNSPAARELLVAHFTSPPSTTVGSDALRADFQAHLTLIGNYPADLRRVAIANGSGWMQGCDFNPGAQLISYEYRSFLVDITGNIWALNNLQSQTIFNGIINRIWPLPDDRTTVTVQPALPWDNAPGGQRASMLQLDTTAVPYGDVVALHANHCFIPTISALDLNVTDPFFNIAGDSILPQRSSFNALYFPSQNQEHVTITPENYEWFMNEALDSLGSPVVVIQSDSVGTRLSWNPIPGARSYRVYSTAVLGEWAGTYAALTDTFWMDPDTMAAIKFFRVSANR